MVDAAIDWTIGTGCIVQQAEQHIGTRETPIELQISAEKSIWFMGSIDRVDTAIVTAATAPDDADALDSDAIDSTSDTSNPEDATTSTCVLDYKSGDARTFQENMGIHLQHYLYTLAYEQTHAGETVAAAGYLLLNEQVAYEEIAQTTDLRAEMQKKVLALLAILEDEEKIQAPRLSSTPAFL